MKKGKIKTLELQLEKKRSEIEVLEGCLRVGFLSRTLGWSSLKKIKFTGTENKLYEYKNFVNDSRTSDYLFFT